MVELDGKMYKPLSDKLYSGIVYDSYTSSDEKKLEGFYRNGLKNGKWKWWNEDGGLDSTGSYKKGLMHGQWEFYFSNGNLKGKGQYRDGNGSNRGDTGISKHGRHGKWTFWYEGGQKVEQNWKNGKEDGLYTTWYENEQKKQKLTYKNGKVEGLLTQWYENVQKVWEETFKDGELIEETRWDEDENETESPGNTPPGKVWSPEHGHWHDAPAMSTPIVPQSSTGPTSEPPGPAPPGKVWSPEHGHWHDDDDE